MKPTKGRTNKKLCKDCGEKYAQEMGKCRRCQQRRIDGLPPLKPKHPDGADD
jgi:ribosomal protein L40E